MDEKRDVGMICSSNNQRVNAMNKIIKIVLSVCVILMMKSPMVLGMGNRMSASEATGIDDGERTASEARGPVARPMKLSIPEVALGHEAVYERFLMGVLVYRPTEGSDVGKIELPIAALANPLDGTFDLSKCGETGRYLSIATGYRKTMQAANANKVEIWITPRFLVEKDISGPACHYAPIMSDWDDHTVPVGLFFNWGGAADVKAFDHHTRRTLRICPADNFSVLGSYAWGHGYKGQDGHGGWRFRHLVMTSGDPTSNLRTFMLRLLND